MKRFFYTTVFLIAFVLTAQAQNGWNWPEDKAKAEEKNVMYGDLLQQKNYKRAIPHLLWLINQAPDLNASLYINGAKIYKALADEAEGDQREVYADSALLMYDLRFAHFPEDKPDALNRKALDSYKYHKNRADKYADMYALYQEVYKINKPSDIMNGNLVGYIDVVRRYKKTGGDISDEQVLEIYEEISEIIDAKKAAEKRPNKLTQLGKYQNNVDKVLGATITVDCNFLKDNLGPRLQADPSNLKLAKQIFKLAYAGKCLDLPIALDAAKEVQKQEPEYGLAKFIGNKSKQNGDLASADRYYKDAISLTDDNLKKSEIYIQMASLANRKGQKYEAKNYALKAVAVNPSMREAYKLIGDLYFKSYDDCKQGKNKVHDRAIFIAAYNMYSKAGNASAMKNAKEQFPSQEDIFTYNMKVGDSYTIPCWVKETVTIEKRD